MNEEIIVIKKSSHELPTDVQDISNKLIEDLFRSIQRYVELMKVIKSDNALIIQITMSSLAAILVGSAKSMGVPDEVVKLYVMKSIDIKNEEK
jgi:hypothetical protein